MGNKKKPTVPIQKQYDWMSTEDYKPIEKCVIQALSSHTPKRSRWVGYVEGDYFYGMISPSHPFPDTFPASYLKAFKTIKFDCKHLKTTTGKGD